MITRIEVDGFKSLRGFSLELSPLTAIIGANGAGKSNLIDVLRLLSTLARTSVTDALKAGRGAVRDQFSRTQGGAVDHIHISTDLLLGGSAADPALHAGGTVQTRVRHTIEIARTAQPSGVEDVSVERERIETLRRADDAWIAAHPALSSMAHYDEEDDLLITLEPNASAFEAAQRRLTISRLRENTHSSAETDRHSSLLSRSNPFFGQTIDDVAAELRSIRFAHLEPERLRLASDRAAGAALAADGSNLPTAFAALPPDVRVQIRADLADLVPGLRSIEVVPAEEELRLEIEFTDGARVPARVLSDGTLRLVALLTLLRSAQPGTLIAVEEPENGIYPGRLRAFVEKLVDATTPRDGALPPQVLLTTHSPAILAALRDRPETLVLADLVRPGMELRSTRMRPVRARDAAPDCTTASIREVERILDAARPEDEA
jgi:predicted ATPase